MEAPANGRINSFMSTEVSISMKHKAVELQVNGAQGTFVVLFMEV